jgi:hypothetical protein
MAAPRRTLALDRLWRDFSTAFPRRDTSSDGWIGDEAHQDRVSGHNPDDTPGARPEYEDADSIPEVRAIDVDVDLRGPATMAQVIERILETPADARRLKYVIHAGRIASKSSGWAWRPYSGSNPHDKHGHFSGDPAYDDDDRPWSVAQMGEGMATVAEIEDSEHEHGDKKSFKNWVAWHNVAEALRRGTFSDWWIISAVKKLTETQMTISSELVSVQAEIESLREDIAAADVERIDWSKVPTSTLISELARRADA